MDLLKRLTAALCALFPRRSTVPGRHGIRITRRGRLDILMQDLRFSVRTLARSPGFTTVAVLTLALGIGANTAMFSVVQGMILAPLPFPSADRLVLLWQNRRNVPQLEVSYPNFEDWERRSQSFDRMSALAFHNFDLTAPGRAEHLVGIRVSSGFLATLGIMPVIGRDITAAEDVPHGPPVVLISDRLWRERFAADPHIAGRSVDLDGEGFTVIGVLPARVPFSCRYGCHHATASQHARHLRRSVGGCSSGAGAPRTGLDNGPRGGRDEHDSAGPRSPVSRCQPRHRCRSYFSEAANPR